MAIQGGRYRGRRLKTPPPVKGQANFTPGLVKEAAFQILDNLIRGEFSSRPEEFAFFDLCSGSGQMGLEALSRSFREVHLAELNSERFSFLVKAVAPYTPKPRLHNKDFARMASRIAENLPAAVYIDPPYSCWEGASCPRLSRLRAELQEQEISDPANAGLILLIQGPRGLEDPLEEGGPWRVQREIRTYRKQILTQEVWRPTG